MTSVFLTQPKLHDSVMVSVPEAMVYHQKLSILVIAVEPDNIPAELSDRMLVKTVQNAIHVLWLAHQPMHKIRNRYLSHPMVRWALADVANYQWLFVLAACGTMEYKYRYSRSFPFKVKTLSDHPHHLPSINSDAVPPPQCIPEDYQVRQSVKRFHSWENTVTAHRQYYFWEQHSQRETWTKRHLPQWVHRYRQEWGDCGLL